MALDVLACSGPRLHAYWCKSYRQFHTRKTYVVLPVAYNTDSCGVDRMNYIDIAESVVDGEGIRVVLFVSGCSEACKGCHNPSSWNYKAGAEYTQDTHAKLLKMLSAPHIQGLTVSGGHPLADKNWKEVMEIIKDVKRVLPEKDIWLYTAYTYDQLLLSEKNAVLHYIDVLVDGRFEESLKDSTLLYRGSSNQKLLKRNIDF